MGSQSSFEESHDHFTLRAKGLNWNRIKRKTDPSKRHPIPLPKGSRKGIIYERASTIRDKSINTEKLFKDDRVYFVLKFTLPLNNSFIKKIIREIKGNVTFSYDDRHSVKLAIKRDLYNEFIKRLEENRRFISDITESYKEQKIDSSLKQIFVENPDSPQDVIMSAIDLSGIKSLDSLESSLRDYVEKKGGRIAPCFKSEKIAIFHANINNKVAWALAENIDIIEKIEGPPKISLAEANQRMPMGIGHKVFPLINSKADSLPLVCVLDSGVNKDHEILREYVVDTHDFSTDSSSPCNDEYGHGTYVAGIVVYCGSYQNNITPKTKVIISKIFDDKGKPIKADLFSLVNETIVKFQNRTRVFNLSFSSLTPNYSLKIAMDQLVYDRGVVLVTSAGNIGNDSIIQEMNNDCVYPLYLDHYHIFSPGDCQNVITVGSISHTNTNICAKHFPSPFTRAGVGNNGMIKPDLVGEGGNMSMIVKNDKVIDLGIEGIMSASHTSNKTLEPVIGTSFSAPSVASIVSSILERYPTSSPFLLKALLLSSCTLIGNSEQNDISFLTQGFGISDVSLAINSIRWRTLYLMEGLFTNNEEKFHRYQFMFPDNANRLILTIVVGRPAISNSSIIYELNKPGTKISSKFYPKIQIGSKRKIFSTFKGIYPIQHGGKGIWKLNIFPSFDTNLDDEIRYACVISVESTKHLDVYSQIFRWMKSLAKERLPSQISLTPEIR
jgi:subtilisin family serine protease